MPNNSCLFDILRLYSTLIVFSIFSFNISCLFNIPCLFHISCMLSVWCLFDISCLLTSDASLVYHISLISLARLVSLAYFISDAFSISYACDVSSAFSISSVSGGQKYWQTVAWTDRLRWTDGRSEQSRFPYQGEIGVSSPSRISGKGSQDFLSKAVLW